MKPDSTPVSQMSSTTASRPSRFHLIPSASLAALAGLLGIFCFSQAASLNASTGEEITASQIAPKAISLDQLGIEALRQQGAKSIEPTAEGARINASLQDLQAEVTTDGLWLRSLADDDADKESKFRLRSTALGRAELRALPAEGTVRVESDLVAWERAGIREEYRVSGDGLRQDFVVDERPEGSGSLTVELSLCGARAEAAPYGAKLILATSGRELAYHRLHVTDANGKELPARMIVASADRLKLEVNDSDASYPVRIDPTFSDVDWISISNPFPGVRGSSAPLVYATALDASGNLYIGGSFDYAGGAKATNIAKWDGGVWTPLGSGIPSPVFALAVDAVGNLYAGGNFTSAGGVAANRIARWNGFNWSRLTSGMNGQVNALAVDTAGNLYAAGSFTSAGGVSSGGVAANNVARWNGAQWSILGSGMMPASGTGFLAALAVDSLGNVYAGGDFTTAGGVAANNIAKWDGTKWVRLGSGTNAPVTALAADTLGNVYAGGSFTSAGGTPASRIARWNGSAWSNLGLGVNAPVLALATDSVGGVYAGGAFPGVGATVNSVLYWNGAIWSVVKTGTAETVYALSVNSSNNLFAGGNFTLTGGVGTPTANHIAQWNGTRWNILRTGSINSYVNALALDSANNLYVGGNFTSISGMSANRVAKWDGSSWSPLGAGLNNVVNTLVTDASNNLFVGGFFTLAGGTTANYIARWNGSAWSAVGGGVNNTVNVLTIDSTGNLYAGGFFTRAGNTPANYIARWNGTSWTAFGTGVNGGVNAIALNAPTNLFAGGFFTTAGGANATYIARWNGAQWSPLGTGVNNTVKALALDASGNLYVGGLFTRAGTVAANRIAKWSGTQWSALGAGMNSRVNSLAIDASGLVYAGGAFTTAGGNPASYIAQWNGFEWIPQIGSINREVTSLLVRNNRLFAGGYFSGNNTAMQTLSYYVAQANLSNQPDFLVQNQSGVTIDNGSTLAFGNVNLGENVAQTLRIQNNSNVTITGLQVTKAGANAADYTVGALGATSLAPGASTTFTLRFAPSGGGARAASIAISSSTPNQYTYGINLSGVGLIPSIRVTNALAGTVANGSTFTFPNVWEAASSVQAFRIWNNGQAPLTGLRITKTGPAAADYTVGPLAATTVQPNAYITVNITFTPSDSGARAATVSIASNDPLKNPYVINLTGALWGSVGLPAAPFEVQSQAGTSTFPSSSTRNFGDVAVGSNSTLTLRIQNTGTTSLTNLRVQLSGTNAGDYEITQPLITTISPGAPADLNTFTTFTVSFKPTTGGQRTASVSVFTNSTSNNPYVINFTGNGLPSGIAIENNGELVVDGGTVDFGSSDLFFTNSRTLTIKNTGLGTLSNLRAFISGNDQDDFSSWSYLGDVAPGATTSITVNFTPRASGNRTAKLSIVSNAPTDNPYVVNLTGFGAEPAIALESDSVAISNGGTLGFGKVGLTSSSTQTVRVYNTGNATLRNLIVTKSGSNANDYEIIGPNFTSILAGSSTSFDIRFSPTAVGNRTATLSIASNAPTNNPYLIRVTGVGSAAEIGVENSIGGAVNSGSTLSFGSLAAGLTANQTLTIRNTGLTPLSILNVVKAGTNASDFTVGAPGATTVAPGATTTLPVSFAPTLAGTRSASISIYSDATNRNPYVINLSGNGLTSAIVLQNSAGINLPTNSTLNLGSANVGSSTSVTVRIRNTGTSPLAGFFFTRSGGAMADFSTTPLSVTSVNPGRSTTFTIRFAPTARGTRATSLLIYSNDPTKNPYILKLTGTGL